MENYKILTDLVRFNTIKDKENDGIINYIENYLKSLGFKTQSKNKNLVMIIGDTPILGFLGHTDTVDYSKNFTSPFNLTLKDDYLYGLGSCDMKGGIAAMLDAVSKIDFKSLKHGMKLYFTYDEESSFGGIKELIKNRESFPQYMIFGEPTNNNILSGSKGLFEIELVFNGIKAHSSNPTKGINANHKAIAFLHQLDEFYNSTLKKFEDPLFEIPYTTMNIGKINGGTDINSLAENCKVSIDFRIVSKTHIQTLKSKINELSQKYNATVNIISCIEPFIDKTPFSKQIKTANYITEASFINNSKRIILGVGPITAHETDEHISIKSYDNLVQQYVDLISTICNEKA